MHKLTRLFMDRGILQPGGWVIFSRKDTMDFVSECEKQNVIILGIDGLFKRDGDAIQPSMENSINFESDPLSKDTSINRYKYALDFLVKQSDELYFEIVCKE